MAHVPHTGVHTNTNPTPSGADTTFLRPGDKFWSLYIEDAEKYDKVRLERWKGDTDGILIFTGLFAATVAALLALTIPQLSPDSGDQNTILLSQILSVLVNHTENGALPASAPPVCGFKASTDSIWINTLWLVSLFLSLVCALGATLVQQWSRTYMQAVQRRGIPSVRGPLYAALATELENFHMEDTISWIVTLLHIAVSLFFAGLLIMILSLDSQVGRVLAGFMAAAALGYLVLSVMPIVTYRSPYRTPLSTAIRHVVNTMMTLANRKLMLHWFSIWVKEHRETLGIIFDKDQISCWSDAHSWKNESDVMSVAHQCLRAGSVAADESQWSDHEWTAYHYTALSQIRQSVDQINEVEDFCEAITSLLDSISDERSFCLREFLFFELDIVDLLGDLLKGDGWYLRRGRSSIRRIISSMTLIRALLHGCDFPHIHRWSMRRSTRPMLVESWYEQRAFKFNEMEDIIPWILVSKLNLLLKHHDGITDKLSIVHCYFLAACRTDVLMICSDRFRSTDASKKLKDFYSIYVLDGYLNSEFLEPYRSGDPDNFSAQKAAVNHALLDNFFWVYNQTLEFVSQPDGIRTLVDYGTVWTPLMEYTFQEAVRVLKWNENPRLLGICATYLQDTLQRLGLRIESYRSHKDRLLKCTEEEHILEHADHHYTPLLKDNPQLCRWLSDMCRKTRGTKSVTREFGMSGPNWMNQIGDPFGELDSASGRMLHSSPKIRIDTSRKINYEDTSNMPEISQNAYDVPIPKTSVADHLHWTAMRNMIGSLFCHRTTSHDEDIPMTP